MKYQIQIGFPINDMNKLMWSYFNLTVISDFSPELNICMDNFSDHNHLTHLPLS